jgi:hypothetical protein
LHTPPGGERGLYCTQAVAAGEPLLAVPWALCLVAEPAPGDVELQSPWHTPLQPSCESRLASTLLLALAGEACDERSAFWQQWSQMLPAPGTLTHPIALPEALLTELQHGALAEAGRAQA